MTTTNSNIQRHVITCLAKNLVKMPQGAEVLCIRPLQDGDYSLYVRTDFAQPAILHEIRAYREGEHFRPGDWEYMGTAGNDAQEWHFFLDRSAGGGELQRECEFAMTAFAEGGRLREIDIPSVHQDLGGHIGRYLEAYEDIDRAIDRVRTAMRDASKEES